MPKILKTIPIGVRTKKKVNPRIIRVLMYPKKWPSFIHALKGISRIRGAIAPEIKNKIPIEAAHQAGGLPFITGMAAIKVRTPAIRNPKLRRVFLSVIVNLQLFSKAEKFYPYNLLFDCTVGYHNSDGIIINQKPGKDDFIISFVILP